MTEPEGYKAYMAADMAPLGKFGGRFLVRGGTREVVEGNVRARTVVIEFPSLCVAALDCYRSGDHQVAADLCAKARPRSICSSSRATTTRIRSVTSLSCPGLARASTSFLFSP